MAKDNANNGNGWVCLHRSIIDWQHWGEPNVVVVFLTLLLHANAKRGWWQGIRCERGETLVTLDTLKDETRLSRPTIIRILRLLEDSGEITRQRIDQKHTKTIIKKYSQYQDFSGFSGKASLPQTLPQTLPKQQVNKDNKNIIDDNKRAHTHEEIVKDMFATGIVIESFCKNEGITVDLCRKLADEVVNEWELIGETHRTDKEVKRHLLDHIRKKTQAMRVNGTLIAMDSQEKRLQPLIQGCKALIDEGHKRRDVQKFYKYMAQPANDKTGRMVFETYKGFDVRYNFIQFIQNEKHYGKAN